MFLFLAVKAPLDIVLDTAQLLSMMQRHISNFPLLGREVPLPLETNYGKQKLT